MKDNLIKTIQKFLNIPFRYADLLVMLDKQKDLLLQDSILTKTEEREYNTLWDTIGHIEELFAYAKESKYIIGAQVSVFGIFDYNYKLRS